jgi:cytochrome c oxidase subunit II
MNELFRRALDLPPQAGSLARSIDTLHYVVISTAIGGALLVFAAIAWLLVRYRQREQAPRTHATVPHSLEVALAGFVLAMFLAFWVVGFSQFRRIREISPDAMRVYVVAKQWMWEAVYPDGTAVQDDIRVPVGQPVALMMTSRDVIHSFYVPSFRLKQDVVPGRITTLQITATMAGTFDILCAEYCGTGHSRMRGHVIAMPPAEFAAWLTTHPTQDLAHEGEKLAAERGCLRCHTVNGLPHLGPTFLHLYRSTVSLTNGDRVVADEAYLTESMMDPVAKIVAGYPPIMPTYLGALSGPEAAAIVEYIRSLR